ncbi:nucleoside/nucleotide kinase family protein [Anaerolentibacter hominis]|uniref:nucleoside/nucleotide kinase family protein n=1 Tax=Anaerolentibacter hominis TaxID=3079009 RepID=UPI0031B87AB7
MKHWKEFQFDVNGLDITARFTQENIDDIFLPLLRNLTDRYREKEERQIVFLAAPPAVGKSTLVNFLTWLSREHEELQEIQAVGLDGFHYHQDYILSHTVTQKDGTVLPMKSVKGSPETYDAARFAKKIVALRKENVMWPIYSRKLHDVVEDQILVDGSIILVEGNWLLFGEGEWNRIKDLCDYSIFISAREEMLKDRLIDRKMKGGLTREEAEAFYLTGDGVNVRRTLAGSQKADFTLELTADGDFEKK